MFLTVKWLVSVSINLSKHPSSPPGFQTSSSSQTRSKGPSCRCRQVRPMHLWVGQADKESPEQHIWETHTHTHVHAHVHTLMQCTHTHPCKYMHTYAYTHMQHTHVYTNAHTHTCNTRAHTHSCAHTHEQHTHTLVKMHTHTRVAWRQAGTRRV